MITLISGTNRKNSLTYQFSAIYFQLLQQTGTDSAFFDLSEVPDTLAAIDTDSYSVLPEKLQDIQDRYFTRADKFIFIIPEYNGSYPGILKLLIDVLDAKQAFHGKKAALTGIATGRAGNLRGMDHLTAVLHHLGVTVLPFQLPVSRVKEEFTGPMQLTQNTENLLRRQINEIIAF